MGFERSAGGILVPDGWTGIFPDMPAAEYHQRAIGIASAGALKLVRKSLAHYAHWARTGFDRRSKAMEFGNIYHCFVLEPERFFNRYVIIPKNAPKRPDERSRNAKNPTFKTMHAMEWWDDFDAKHAGKDYVAANDYQKVQDMRAALDNVDMVGELPGLMLADGQREVSVRWVDEETGLPCRARFDWWLRPLFNAADLKSCFDASEEGFGAAVVRNEYHVSAAHYIEAARALGEPLDGYYFLAQETEPPYVAACWPLDIVGQELGYRMWRTAMNKLAEGVKHGKFPGYTTQARELALPAYAHYKE